MTPGVDLFARLGEQAQNLSARIVLPETNDERILKAAIRASEEKYARIILIGRQNSLYHSLSQLGNRSDNEFISIIDPTNSELTETLAQTLYAKRKHKGMSLQQAHIQTHHPLTFAYLLQMTQQADGCVAGACTSTAEVIRTALQIIGVRPDCKLVSSFFIMVLDKSYHQYSGNLIFADCAMNITPSAQDLCEIAKASIHSATSILQIEPNVAFLSFSSNNSAEHEEVEKVRLASELTKQALPKVDIIGEIQLDAALDTAVFANKFSGTDSSKHFSPPANILIFPSLEAGNIGYKLLQYFANAKAVGPILQGLNKPVNDLSRGCTIDDIVNNIIITANQHPR